MQYILAKTNAGYDTDEVGELMTKEEFNNEISEEEYNKELEAFLNEEGPIG